MRDPTEGQARGPASKRWRTARPGLATVTGCVIALVAATGLAAAPAGAATSHSGAGTHSGAAARSGPRRVLTFPELQPGRAGPAATGTSTKGELTSDVCTSSSSCLAVGYSGGSSSAPVSEQWNGTVWKKLKTPDPSGADQTSLEGVSCTSAKACTAVGYYDNSAGTALTLAERWNGKTWTQQTTPDAGGAGDGNYLQSVSCSSPTACTATGYYEVGSDTFTLAEQWNGEIWELESTPNGSGSASELTGVSCVSPEDCNAVGYSVSGSDAVTLAEQWNGEIWEPVPTQNPSGASDSYLLGVSCSTATGCLAVGTDHGSDSSSVPLAETFDGSEWTTTTTPNLAGEASALQSVSCTTADICTTVGEYAVSGDTLATLAEAWNGSQWSTQTTPNGPDATTSDLTAVSCDSTCIAVGLTTINGVTYPVGAIGIARIWTWAWIMPTPNPGPPGDVLNGVSCTSPTACTAVGYYLNSTPTQIPMALRLTNGTWIFQAIPIPGGSLGSMLNGVSCTSATTCTAVGYYINSSGTQVALTETWSGGGWSMTPAAAIPAGTTVSILNGVSCTSASTCTAVGYYVNSSVNSGMQETLIETLSGGSWSVTTPGALPNGTISALNGVSCTSATACTAVGYYYNNNTPSTQVALAETLSGGTWNLTPAAAVPATATATVLNGVSCSSATACTAVGYYDNNNIPSTQVALAETLSGGTWNLTPAAAVPAGATASDLTGVSCHTFGCAAVGYYVNGAGTQVTLAENELALLLPPHIWLQALMPNPPAGATASALNAVSCTPSTTFWPWWYTCTEVGYYNNAAGVSQTLAEQ
jgi:hypothetical protein